MKVSEAINSRRSMRVFKADPVARADIEWIISNANRAASNGNLQPWKLYVTMGAARKRLSAAILSAMDASDHGPDALCMHRPCDQRNGPVCVAAGWFRTETTAARSPRRAGVHGGR